MLMAKQMEVAVVRVMGPRTMKVKERKEEGKKRINKEQKREKPEKKKRSETSDCEGEQQEGPIWLKMGECRDHRQKLTF